MKNIAIFTLTSELHDEQAVSAMTNEFLGSLGIDYDYPASDYTDYGQHALDLIYVRTGGTEGIFRRLLPDLLKQSGRPFYLLTSGKSNSLAASLEILSFLRQQGYQGEVIHGNREYVNQRILLLEQAGEARQRLKGCRLGIVGQPSDWLISSQADANVVRRRLGIELVEIENWTCCLRPASFSEMGEFGRRPYLSRMSASARGSRETVFRRPAFRRKSRQQLDATR